MSNRNSHATAQEGHHRPRHTLWWNLAFGGVTLTISVVTVMFGVSPTLGESDTATRVSMWVSLLAVWGILVLWLCIGSRALADGKTLNHHESTSSTDARWYVYLTLPLFGVAVLLNPSMATLQAVCYPSFWMLAANKKQAIRWNILLASVMTVVLTAGYFLRAGTLLAASSGLIIGVVSFAFSIAMGLWITSVYEYGVQRDQLVQQLRESQEVARRQASEAAADRERRRMAHDLHDTVSQSLAGIVMLSQQAKVQAAAEPPGAAKLLATIVLIESSAQEALREARTLVAVNSSAELHPDSLLRAMRQVCDRFGRESGVAVQLDVSHLDVPEQGTSALDRDRQVLLLRVVQELLANVRKHAQATRVVIEMERQVDALGQVVLVLSVVDDGVGLPEGFEIGQSAGFGLQGLRDRGIHLGGDVRITRVSGGGTRASCRLPVAVSVTASVPGHDGGVTG